jgi:hypothetical protein
MNDAMSIEQVRAIQASMVESGRSYLLETELEDLRCLVRLTAEFFHYLQGEKFAPLVEDNLRYVCDSVFSGVDSFGLVSAAYRVLPGARQNHACVGREIRRLIERRVCFQVQPVL